MRRIAIVFPLVAACASASTPTTSEHPAASASASAPPSAPHYSPVDIDACVAGVHVPAARGTLDIPPSVLESALRPTMRALCTCVPGAREVDFTATLVPDEGRTLRVTTDADLQACVDGALGAERFPAFALGSDCIDCGPKHYGVFGGTPPPKEPSKLTIALRFRRP